MNHFQWKLELTEHRRTICYTAATVLTRYSKNRFKKNSTLSLLTLISQ